MIASLAIALLTAQTQDFGEEARKLNERIQAITARIGEMREKKLIHADALTEIETFLESITRNRGNLQAQGKQLDERRVILEAKKKEVESLEKSYHADSDAYEKALQRHNAQREDLDRRSAAIGREIDDHNAKKDWSRSESERQEYNANAERLNNRKAQLQGEINQFNAVQVPAINERYEQVERKRVEFKNVQGAYFDLVSKQDDEVGDFRAVIDSMSGPADELYSIVEASRKTGPAAAWRVFADAADAAASTLAEAYGAAPDLPEETLRDTFVIRRAKDRTSTRVYIIEKLRLGELIEALRGLRSRAVDQLVSADRLLDSAGLAGFVSKPCSLARGKDGAAWSFGVARIQPQAEAPIRRP